MIIEDDPDLCRVLGASLQQEGYVVLTAADGPEGLSLCLGEEPDLVLLDVMLPQMDGWEVCRRLRASSGVPILFLTSSDSETDIMRGLNAGADGYICKPFGLAEVKVRVEATLRRMSRRQPYRPVLYDDGSLYINLQDGLARKKGEALSLSPKEFQLLSYLLRHAGQVVPHRELLINVWGSPYAQETSYLAQYVLYIRRKIEDDPAEPRYLVTRHGVGYCFEARPSALKASGERLTGEL